MDIDKFVSSLPIGEFTFADYMLHRLRAEGTRHVFGVTGGGIMHIIDSFSRYSCCELVTVHHEGFGGLAADAYARITNGVGCALGTTGPGVTNLFTSIAAAWQDSSSVLFIGGQVKAADSSRLQGLSVRQYGTFEFDAIDAFSPITKYARLVDSPMSGVVEIEKAIGIIQANRPGPAYLEVPLDVQGQKLTSDLVRDILQSSEGSVNGAEQGLAEIEIALDEAPLFIFGAGVLKSRNINKLRDLISKKRIPYVVTPLAIGFSNVENLNYMGVIGLRGNRSANIISQQAKKIVIIGSSLHQQIVGWEPSLFNPNAEKIWFEIDEDVSKSRAEALGVEHCFKLEVDQSVEVLYDRLKGIEVSSDWVLYASRIREKYLNHDFNVETFGIYSVVAVINSYLDKFSVIATDAGQPWYVLPQALRVSGRVKYLSSGSFGAMGMTVPYLVGASKSSDGRAVLGVIGDGSLMMCLQELATLKTYVKDFILIIINNNGYRSIKATHDKFFDGRKIGTDGCNGVFIPSYSKLVSAFELNYTSVASKVELESLFDAYVDGGLVIEAFVPDNESIEPAVMSRLDDNGKFQSSSIDEMYPFVDFERFLE